MKKVFISFIISTFAIAGVVGVESQAFAKHEKKISRKTAKSSKKRHHASKPTAAAVAQTVRKSTPAPATTNQTAPTTLTPVAK